MSAISTILTTQRLQLRPVTMSDVDSLHAFWTTPGIRKYLWDDVVIAREQVTEIIASSIHDFAAYGFGHWIVTYKNDAALIGWCGLRHFGEPPEVEVLYGIVPQLWGQGLAVEAARAVLQHGFATLGLERIFAGTDPPNTASVHVMEKIGMRFDQRKEINGLEAIYYVMSREEFPWDNA